MTPRDDSDVLGDQLRALEELECADFQSRVELMNRLRREQFGEASRLDRPDRFFARIAGLVRRGRS